MNLTTKEKDMEQPDLHKDTLNELLKKRDALVILKDCGYNIQPELDRVCAKIVQKVDQEGVSDDNTTGA
jgi:hypothetical protein